MMSKNKISAKAISNALAKELNLSQAAADNFLNEFQKVVAEAIVEDKVLKINNLGTFRLVWVEPRKSVNVQTGEPLEIAGHYKLSFVPENDLKENINQMSEKTEQKDPLKKLGEQAEELKDMLDLINGDSEEVATEPEPANEPEGEPEVEPISEPVEEPVPQPEEAKSESESATEPVEKVEKVEKNEPEIPQKHNKKCCCAVVWLVILLLLAVVSLSIYAFWKEPFLNVCNQVCTWFSPNKNSEILAGSDDKNGLLTDTIALQNVDSASMVAEKSIFDQPREYTEFFGTEIVGKGSRLAWISYKYYGHKAFWVYIYEANRDKIDNPNKIQAGNKVRVPKLPAYLVDTTNEECMRYAESLHNKYLENY